MKKEKLIIWDFDGVIADTEPFWVRNWQRVLNKHFNLGLTYEETAKWNYGASLKIKEMYVKEHFGLDMTDEVWADIYRGIDEVFEKGFELVEGVEEVIALDRFDRCLASNGGIRESIQKMETTKLWKYFPREHLFSHEFVPRGKPAPDLFLYAAEKMGYLPTEAIVIEDSLPGLRAGLSAGMKTVAFVGCATHYGADYVEKIRALGVTEIFDTMAALKNYLDV